MSLNRFKYLLIVVIILAGCKTLPAADTLKIAPLLKTDVYDFNLKGPVKSIKEYATRYTPKELSEEKKTYYQAAGFIDLFLGLSFTRYDRNEMKISRQRLLESFDSIYPDTSYYKRSRSFSYFYQKEDYKEKKEYIKDAHKLSSFVYNPLEIKLNTTFTTTYSLKVQKDSSSVWKGNGYDYIFDSSSKIQQEQKFYYRDKDRDGIADSKNIFYNADYLYNEKNQLIKKEYKIVYKYPTKVSIDHGIEIPALQDIHPIEEYRYDDVGNLTAVYLYKTAEKQALLFLEQYTYDEHNKLIKLKRIKRTDGTFVNKHVRVINELFFNDQGEVSKVIAYNNDDKTVYATRLYTYEDYDRFGNWTKCNKYLDGEITKVPTSITYRRFQYYDD